MEHYMPALNRYESMTYNRCGNSGIELPAISLGLWQNFSAYDQYAQCRAIVTAAFDKGITHFDLANNYGPPAGHAEQVFGELMKRDLMPWRDELLIATKAGYDMWPGPYGNWGSRKYLVSSLDQSLKRMNLDYVDIFYSHRPDPNTPMEETMQALDHVVKQGKALYAGISNYDAAQTKQALQILEELRTPFIIHQAKYNMFDRTVEQGLTKVLAQHHKGLIAFSPLAQGLLTEKYLHGIPDGSRASRQHTSLRAEQVSAAVVGKVEKLYRLASARGQSMAQMAIAWLLFKGVNSVLVGASSVSQLFNSIGALENIRFDEEEIRKIEEILRT